MSVCPQCGREIPDGSKSCPGCDTSLDGSPGSSILPKAFWVTLAGSVLVVIVTLLDWIKVRDVGYNLFGLWGQSRDSEWLLASFQELAPIRTYIISLSILLIASYALLLASLIRYKSKEHKILSYCGFGLSVFVGALFNIIVIANYASFAALSLTMYPILAFVVATIVISLVRKLPESFCDVVKIITRMFIHISYAALLCLLILTVTDVVRRFFLGIALTGVTEYSQMFLIVSMAAMAHSLIEGKFILVNTLVEKFPKWLNISIEIFMGVCAIAFFCLIGWQLVNQVESSKIFREAYFMIQVPRWPMYAILGASFLACALATIVYVYERVTGFKDPKQKNALDDPEIAFLKQHDDGSPEIEDLGGAK